VVGVKKGGEKSYRIAQLSTLAAFLPWGSSKGADRMTLTSHKVKVIFDKCKSGRKKISGNKNTLFFVAVRWQQGL